MQYDNYGEDWSAAASVIGHAADRGGSPAPLPLPWSDNTASYASVQPDWGAVRRRLSAICDPQDLTAYLGRCFAQTDRACDHTFAQLAAYFDADPQQALTMFQFFDDLDVRCDCEAFFILRMLTC